MQKFLMMSEAKVQYEQSFTAVLPKRGLKQGGYCARNAVHTEPTPHHSSPRGGSWLGGSVLAFGNTSMTVYMYIRMEGVCVCEEAEKCVFASVCVCVCVGMCVCVNVSMRVRPCPRECDHACACDRGVSDYARWCVRV